MIYEAKCEKCGRKETYSRKVSDREETPVCCKQPMKRVFSPTRGFVDIPAYRK